MTGVCIEDVNHEMYGGISSQMVFGESFQEPPATPVEGFVAYDGAWAVDGQGRPAYAVVPGGEHQREMAFRFGINLVIYALTGNYKTDVVHAPALLQRLGNER